MRLLLLAQADHLAAVALNGLQKIEKLTVTTAEQLATNEVLNANFDAILWLAGAVPIAEASPTAAKLANFGGKILAVGAGNLALAQHYGAVINLSNSSSCEAELLPTNNNDKLLRHLSRQEIVSLVLPQFAMQQLPNALSPLAKTPQGIILAWKHKKSAQQGIAFHPFAAKFQPQGLALISAWLSK
jgi:anthranilate/para-aminobenzoate synthase component II